MIAEYANPKIALAPSTRTIHLDFSFSSGAGAPAAGDPVISYHLFDADTGTVILDGPRVQPSASVHFDIDLPPENGRYQVWISPLREGIRWYYEQGFPFLLLEAEVANGAARLIRTVVTTTTALHRRQAVRSVGRAFVYPFLTIWRNRSLIRVMVRREVLGRYRGSFGGSFWTVMNPLLLILTYFFVFSLVLRSKFPGDPSRAGYVLYFVAGMLPWLAFSEAVGRAPTVVIDHRNFVKKLVFAVETLPFNLVAGGLVSEFFAVLVYCAILLVIRHSIPLTVLWLPLLIIPQVLFTAGLTWFLAALGAFLRDLGQLIGFVLTIWFFISPICYPEQSWEVLPAWASHLLAKNPICILVRGYRSVFLESHPPDFGPLWKFWILAAAVFVIGHAWFYKLRKSFADMI